MHIDCYSFYDALKDIHLSITREQCFTSQSA